MKFSRQLIPAIVFSVFLLTGCAITPKDKMIGNSTDYNLVVEKAQNDMLFINIIRASKRYPMYFTNFKQLRGSMSYAFETGSITVPFGKVGLGGPGTTTSYSIAPKISYSTNPQFDLNVSDDKEFTQCMMTPGSLETVDFYLKQGWPDLMLWNLFIDKMEIQGVEYSNDPLKIKEFNEFEDKLVELFACDRCLIEIEEKRDVVGPEIEQKDLTADVQLDIARAKFKITPIRDKKGFYQLESDVKKSYRLTCERRSEVFDKEKKGLVESEKGNVIFMRSPEGILYYLGEILRAEEKNIIPEYSTATKHCKEKRTALFLAGKPKDKDNIVWQKAGTERPYVEVDYDGDRYVIPRMKDGDTKEDQKADRSMHVMSFISLLIAKQRPVESAPATGVVSVIR